MKKTTVITYFFLFLFYSLLILVTTVNISCSPKEVLDKSYELNGKKSDISEILYPAKITAVIDGDTVKIQFKDDIPKDCTKNETVRLIGVNTPELNLHKDLEAEYFAEEAFLYTNRYYKEDVDIQLDNISSMRDKYGRLLAYIWLCNSTLLNKNLIEDGYGRYYSAFLFNEKYMKEFSEAELQAMLAEKGIWGGR